MRRSATGTDQRVKEGRGPQDAARKPNSHEWGYATVQ